MSRTHRATESLSADAVLARLPERVRWMPVLLRRIQRLTPFPAAGVALDIGAAQGLNVAALMGAGWDAVGIEPSEQAIETSIVVAERAEVELRIIQGFGEALPFAPESFDLVLAQSVLEHVTDPDLVFREVQRVLRRGGAFFFFTTNALCPRQSEIRGFPCFPWYPDSLRRRIMDWARTHRPALIGYTDTPALHWFTPWRIKRQLHQAGFSRTFDHWDMKRDDDVYLRPAQRRVVALIAAQPLLRLGGDMFVKSSAYLAVK